MVPWEGGGVLGALAPLPALASSSSWRSPAFSVTHTCPGCSHTLGSPPCAPSPAHIPRGSPLLCPGTLQSPLPGRLVSQAFWVFRQQARGTPARESAVGRVVPVSGGPEKCRQEGSIRKAPACGALPLGETLGSLV